MSGPELPDDDDMQAAEYVLGLLPPPASRAMEALALHDERVAASIAEWERILLPLVDLVQPVEPPPNVWRRLALAIGAGVPEQAAPRARAKPWQLVSFWRATTAGAMALAASLALALLDRAPTPPSLVAALAPYGGPGAQYLIEVRPDGSATVVAVGTTAVAQGRALELWALAAGASAPVSLGLLPATGRVRMAVPAAAGTQLLVSDEPAGGSPTKQPTGPVVYAGQLTGI